MPSSSASATERAEPGPTYVVGDLTSYELPSDAPQRFDAILCAGNVLGFLHPDTRRPVLERFASWLKPDGRAVIGFGAGRGYAFDDFFANADFEPDTSLPASHCTYAFVERDGGTRATYVSGYDSAEALQQVLDMGMEEGSRSAINQIDEFLAR